MALLTSCQNTFQSVVAYEDALGDVETLKIQVHECYLNYTILCRQYKKGLPKVE